jgi:hypothetical protein
MDQLRKYTVGLRGGNLLNSDAAGLNPYEIVNANDGEYAVMVPYGHELNPVTMEGGPVGAVNNRRGPGLKAVNSVDYGNWITKNAGPGRSLAGYADNYALNSAPNQAFSATPIGREDRRGPNPFSYAIGKTRQGGTILNQMNRNDYRGMDLNQQNAYNERINQRRLDNARRQAEAKQRGMSSFMTQYGK